MKKQPNYRHRITLQTLTQSSVDAGNNPVYTATNYFSCKAEMILSGGREFVAGGRVNAETTHVFHSPWCTKISSTNNKMQLVLGTQTLPIVAAYDRDGERKEFRIEAKLLG